MNELHCTLTEYTCTVHMDVLNDQRSSCYTGHVWRTCQKSANLQLVRTCVDVDTAFTLTDCSLCEQIDQVPNVSGAIFSET